MKKLFEIDNSERQRILEMHIDATKRNYITEQQKTEEIKKWDSGIIAAYFPNDKGQITDLPKDQLDVLNKKVDEMSIFLGNEEYKNKKITMKIEVSTSTSGTRQRNEELADERLESAKKYINQILGQKVDQSILKNMVVTEDKKIQQGEDGTYRYFRIQLFVEMNKPIKPITPPPSKKVKSPLQPITVELTAADWEFTPVEYRYRDKATPDTRNIVLHSIKDNRTDPATIYYLPTPSPLNPLFKLINPNTGKVVNSPRAFGPNEKTIKELSFEDFKGALSNLPSSAQNVFIPRAEAIYNNQVTQTKTQKTPQQ
jgi:hypothetical protein